MLASIRKRQASSPEQAMDAKRRAQELVAKGLQARARSPEAHHRIRVQSCCICAKVFSTPHSLLSCTDCDHTICTRCPVDDPLVLIPHPGLVQQRYEDMNKEDEHGNLGMGQSMFQRDREHELGHDAEEEAHQQELQLQSHSQPTGKQRQVKTGVPSKRSLNMSKCERCRLDKKKCIPVDRVWPTKCDLCIKKGFSCSESKRIVRSTKHAPATTPSPMNTISPLPTSTSFEERLKQWCFLLSYRKMMMAAKDQLEKLEKSLISPFPLLSHVTKKTGSDSYSRFSLFTERKAGSLATVLSKHATELFTLEPTSHNLPGWFLTTHLNQYSFEPEINIACSDCFPAHPRSRASEIESSRDFCGELLLLQHRIIHHLWQENGWEEESWRAHVNLSHEIRRQASEIFASCGLREGAEWAKSSGVFHPDDFGWLPFQDLTDCLMRSQLHLLMDCGNYSLLPLLFESEPKITELKDRQDILGRTPLLMACKGRYNGEVVEILLKEKADPGLATIYGSLPLHYAAAIGSVEICKLLLMHKPRFDIKAVDNAGKTALDYAKEKRRQKVVDLLSAEYATADREEEELRRARSLEVGTMNYDVLGSYDV